MNGTLASQRMIRATLQTLPEEGVRQGVKAPAILVIGEVCALADTCAWREEKPVSYTHLDFAGTWIFGV